MILDNYTNITEDEIRSMPHSDLVEAVLRIFKTREIKCQDYYGKGIISDDLADAFRGRM